MTTKRRRRTPDIPLADREHALYEIKNSKTGKRYVGIAWNPKERWSTHKTVSRRPKGGYTIHNAMRKYGIDNFTHTILGWFPKRKPAADAERELIATGTCEYNEAPGGDGGYGTALWTEEGKRKLLEASRRPKGPMPYYHKEAIRQGHLNNPKVVSQETRDKISAAKKGKPKSEEHKAILRTLRLGVKLTPESIAKRTAKVKGMKKSPEVVANMKKGQEIRRRKEREEKEKLRLASLVPPDLKPEE